MTEDHIFPHELVYQAIPRARRVVITHDQTIYGVFIPRGFQSDGASIPTILWPLVGSPYAPEVIGAAVVHDYLYSHDEMSRKAADRLFYKLLRLGGVGWLRAKAYWLAVRLFGGIARWLKEVKSNELL